MPTFKRVKLHEVVPGSIVTRPQYTDGQSFFGTSGKYGYVDDGLYLVVPYNTQRIFLCGIGGHWKYPTGKIRRGVTGCWVHLQHTKYNDISVEVVHDSTLNGILRVPEDAV